MKTVNLIPSVENIVKAFEDNKDLLSHLDNKYIGELRAKAIKHFALQGFPKVKDEDWKNTDISESLNHSFNILLDVEDEPIDIDKLFKCEINNFETYLFSLFNGWYVYRNKIITHFSNGVIVGSLAEAIRTHSHLVNEHFGKYACCQLNGLISLNTAFSQDGVFIYVPDNVKVEMPFQLVNLVDSDENILVNTRNLIILGKNSSIKLIHCDDSIRHSLHFVNTVTEIYLDENSEIDYYKLQNKDSESSLINSTFFKQENNSRLLSNIITLNGGIIRNNSYVDINGKGCQSDLYGLYLVDKKQHIDNQVYIDHKMSDSGSFELYKGIIDDEASAVFNGHIVVRPDSQRTIAYQTNRNILLTDKAKVHTKPFLEISADDVKCSHGASVGQLDNEAMFYLRSRGLCERNAKMLLMYAFAAEVVNQIKIEALKERIDNMVMRRLKGELSICDQCILHCSNNASFDFDIKI
jgi:Fe-S cluster assembly protein SufD